MVSNVTSTPQRKSYTRYNNIKYSGYVAISSMTACAVTGFHKIKVPHKQAVHKTCALVAGISAFWHLGAIKQWDKFFTKNAQ